MRIVEPYAKMLSPWSEGAIFTHDDGADMLRRIEYYARVSHASEDKITSDSYDRFLRSVVLTHGDWSVTEHEKVTCEFLVDRGITHEIVRHRIASYTQESTRFINYQKRGAVRPSSSSHWILACLIMWHGKRQCEPPNNLTWIFCMAGQSPRLPAVSCPTASRPRSSSP